MRLLYISAGNIPSRWAHTVQAMKMAEALAARVESLTLLTSGTLLPSPVGEVDLAAHYGVGRCFRTVALPVRWRTREPFFQHYTCGRFDAAAALYARCVAPDLVYTRSTGAAAHCARLGLATVVETHTDAAGPLFRALGPVARSPHLRGLVTTTEALRDDYVAAGFPDERILVWPDAVDPDRFAGLPDRHAARRALGLPSDRPLAVYCGHFYEPKGVPALIDAARLAPEIEFLLVGGWPADIEAMRRRARGCDNVRFAGFVANGRIPTYLAAADALLLPNSARFPEARTTSPLKLFEYLAAGRPVVATRIPALDGILRDERDALLVEPDAPDAIAHALRRLARDGDLARRLAEGARALAPRFTWERRAGDILARFAPTAVNPVIPTTGARVAFVTPEYATEHETGGGLGSYLLRMTSALRDCGHAPEIFVTTRGESGTIVADGVPVHRVASCETYPAIRLALRACRALRLRAFAALLLVLGDAWRLAAALRRHEADAPFDLVQSADYLASGLFVRRTGRRPHLVRCSRDGVLWARANRENTRRRRWQSALERGAVRRADAAYAPSHFVADGLRRHGLSVAVVRPPWPEALEPDKEAPAGLPPRYLVHFGQLSRKKGTDWLARALPRVWEREPDFSMVWAGPDHTRSLAAWRTEWGEHSGRVVWLGELTRPSLYAVLERAEAAVLPSRADNLPNTAIESLALGVPVIGTAGASLDELVEDGHSGELVPEDDDDALAQALLRAWRGESPARRGFQCDSETISAMHPPRAVEALLLLAREATHAGGARGRER